MTRTKPHRVVKRVIKAIRKGQSLRIQVKIDGDWRYLAQRDA